MKQIGVTGGNAQDKLLVVAAFTEVPQSGVNDQLRKQQVAGLYLSLGATFELALCEIRN